MPDDTKERAFHARAPDAVLAGLVLGLYGYLGGSASDRGLIEPARLVVALILNFGAPYRIALGRKPGCGETWRSFVGGLHPGPVWIESGAGAECVQINLTPLGARRLFREPANAFASRLVALDDLGDRGLAALARRLADMKDWGERLRLTEDFLISRLAAPGEEDPGVVWAFNRILERKGRVQTGALCESLGWSRRRFARHFERDFGLHPKIFARMTRFEAALRLAGAADPPGWADIAAATGYADQSHLTREFTALAGRPPARWRAAR